MSLTNDAVYLHRAYEEAHHEVRDTIDEAYKEVRRIFVREGFKVANNDPAEELAAQIYRYWMDSGND